MFLDYILIQISCWEKKLYKLFFNLYFYYYFLQSYK